MLSLFANSQAPENSHSATSLDLYFLISFSTQNFLKKKLNQKHLAEYQ